MTSSRRHTITVLVTGVGAPVGVSIVKAARQSQLAPRIVATDADPMSVGLFRADAAYVMPRVTADEAGYIEQLEEICTREQVSMVCFGSEIEMRRIAPHRQEIERATGSALILNEPQHLEIFMDKWAMTCALRDQGLPVPDTVLATDPEAVRSFLARNEFPFILKSRHGSRSKNVFVVRRVAELDLLARYVAEPVLQEYLFPDAEEYTVGVYKSPRSGYLGQMVIRRELGAGLTYKAEVVRDPEIEDTCRAIAESFDVWGPVNIQLRKTAAGVRIFEINLRFSSSAVMRSHFGFNEPELCLRDIVLGESPSRPEIRAGYAFRYWDEVYLDPGEYAAGEPGLQRRGRSGRLSPDF